MNVEHTKQLLDGVISAGGSDELIDALRSELDAKLTPITAEALLADGWNADPEGTWSYRVDLLEWILIERRGDAWELITTAGVYPLPGVHTMYDLRELVRLIGGSQ